MNLFCGTLAINQSHFKKTWQVFLVLAFGFINPKEDLKQIANSSIEIKTCLPTKG